MPREKECYRETLGDILTYFDGKRMLRIGEVCRYLQLDPKTVHKRYPFEPGGYISAIVLAQKMS